MDVSKLIQGILTFALSVVPWFFPDLCWHYKVMIVLSVIIVSLVIYYFQLSKKAKCLKNELAEITQRHTALASQFDKKLSQEKRYEQSFENLSLILHLACMNTKEAKLKDIYNAFLLEQRRIIDN